MYDPFAGQPGMQPQVMPNPVPVQPTLSPNNALAAVSPFDPRAFHQAMMDWRGQRPQFAFDPTLADPMGVQRANFRNTLVDWRQQRPNHSTFMGGTVPPIGG